jgi:hypothetical protein
MTLFIRNVKVHYLELDWDKKGRKPKGGATASAGCFLRQGQQKRLKRQRIARFGVEPLVYVGTMDLVERFGSPYRYI